MPEQHQDSYEFLEALRNPQVEETQFLQDQVNRFNEIIENRDPEYAREFTDYIRNQLIAGGRLTAEIDATSGKDLVKAYCGKDNRTGRSIDWLNDRFEEERRNDLG